MTVFSAHDPDTWLEHKPRSRPQPGDPASTFVAYNLAAGPVGTPDVRRVRAAIERAQRRNTNAPLSTRSVVIIDGPPLAGKTYAALSVAVEQTIAATHDPPPDPLCYRSRTWAYVEALNYSGSAGIAKSIATQVGAITDGRRRTTADHLEAIRHMAPKVGLKGVIIDDSHGMRGARTAASSSSLATTLKGLITGVPATTVIIGANLQRDNILTGTTGEQVRLSARDVVMCGTWDSPTGEASDPWVRLVKEMRTKLAFPRGTEQFQLAKRSTLQLLATGSQGRAGLAIDWIKEAACHAVTHDRPLDRSALEATADSIGIDPVNDTRATA